MIMLQMQGARCAHKFPRSKRLWSVLIPALLLSACEVGPDYHRPDAIVPAKYKEPMPEGWKPSEPKNAASDGRWWSIYDDPVLDALEQQVNVSNQTLKADEAAVRQSAATLRQARAAFFPTLSLAGDASRSRVITSANRPAIDNEFDLGVSASWAPDLWGSIRRTVEGDAANVQASAAQLASARLSMQAMLASDYFELRIADELKNLLDETVVAYNKTLSITKNQYTVGVAAKADVVTAETQVENTVAQDINVGVQRAQLEHAIAVLIGKPPGDFAVEVAQLTKTLPGIPAGVPSALLERRPDIAVAERQMAAANAQIGVATAAYFPDLTLSGSGGFSSTVINSLFAAPMGVWSMGSALTGPLFDAGARSAQVSAARAAYDASVANYRETVLSAFQQVEDQLAAQEVLIRQAVVQERAIALAKEAEQLTLNEYKQGIVSFTAVVTAETIALASEQAGLTIRQSQLVASVTLVQALGGGWDSSKLPQKP